MARSARHMARCGVPVQDPLRSHEGVPLEQGDRQRRRRPSRIATCKVGDEIEIHRPLGRKQLITVLGVADEHICQGRGAAAVRGPHAASRPPEEIEIRRIERIYRAAATPPTRPDRDMRRTLRRLKRGE